MSQFLHSWVLLFEITGKLAQYRPPYFGLYIIIYIFLYNFFIICLIGEKELLINRAFQEILNDEK